MVRYRHTQVGYLTIAMMAAAIVLILALMISIGIQAIAAGVLVFIIAALYLFSSLTVIIDDEYLEARFGPGLVKKRILLRDIESAQAVRNHWYNGWGIRGIPGGWMYNVSGLSAVEITLKNGTHFRIGTDAPQELESAIQDSI